MNIIIDSPVNVRFIEVCTILANHEKTTVTGIGKAVDEPSQSFTDIKAGRKRVQEDLIDRVCIRFPDVNKAYIYTGMLPKFKSDLFSETDRRLSRIEEGIQEALTILRNLDKKP